MRIFLDANILVSVLNNEYPLVNYTARLLSVAEKKKIKMYTSPTCLAIAFYFSSKKSGAVVAKKKIGLLCEHINIAITKPDDIKLITSNKKIADFEDGIQYYAAVNANCDCIVTEDTDDYHFSEIEVLNTENFMDAYVL